MVELIGENASGPREEDWIRNRISCFVLFWFFRFLWRYPVKLNGSAIQVSDRTVKDYRLAMMINVTVQSECLTFVSDFAFLKNVSF